MRTQLLVGSLAATAASLSLKDLCTPAYAASKLPAAGTYQGIAIDPASVITTLVSNYTLSNQVFYPDATVAYRNITLSYTHDGRKDLVHVAYFAPDPSAFKNRFLATGGGGLAINSGATSVTGGVSIGAVAGLTDGGFGSFNVQEDAHFLLANGTVNWENAYMFGYQAIREMTVLGKAFTKNLMAMQNSTTLYAYYQGCSEGGREGWSQVQRFEELDGASLSAPALRYVHQQIQHLYSNVFCDPLDGKTDGVVARSDLCKLHFNVNTTIGLPYYCPAKAGGVAQTITNGLHDSQGQQAYFSYPPGATFDDAQTKYNTATDEWELNTSGLGGEFTYSDSLQTTWPDLSRFGSSGGKILAVHGESDASIPAASSVPDGAGPQTVMAQVVEWVENGRAPELLDATVLLGEEKGQSRKICLWRGFDIDSWHYELDAFKLPVY
ncbi:tannase and feruloyl esterase [Lizonia empirigonia]|nr:tannase and feruloyl esterase [Lizonia empirigonia]